MTLSLFKNVSVSKIIGASLLALSVFAPVASHAANIGPDQEIYVQTVPNIDSHCIIRNSNSSWYTSNTPTHLNVLKSSEGLDIECYSADNLWHGKRHFKAKFSGQSIAGFIYGGLSNGGQIANMGLNDGAGMGGYWTQTPNNLIVPIKRVTPILKEAEVIDNDEAYRAIPSSGHSECNKAHKGKKSSLCTYN